MQLVVRMYVDIYRFKSLKNDKDNRVLHSCIRQHAIMWKNRLAQYVHGQTNWNFVYQ